MWGSQIYWMRIVFAYFMAKFILFLSFPSKVNFIYRLLESFLRTLENVFNTMKKNLQFSPNEAKWGSKIDRKKQLYRFSQIDSEITGDGLLYDQSI